MNAPAPTADPTTHLEQSARRESLSYDGPRDYELRFIGKANRKQKNVDIQQAFLVLGAKGTVSEQEAEIARHRLAWAGIDPNQVSVSYVPEYNDDNTEVTGWHTALHLKHMDKQGDKGKAISHEKLLGSLSDAGLITEQTKEQCEAQAADIQKGFFKRVREDGPAKAVRHKTATAGLEVIGFTYNIFDMVSGLYGELLNQNAVKNAGMGDRAFFLAAWSGTLNMLLFGTDNTGRSQIDKMLADRDKAMAKDPAARDYLPPEEEREKPGVVSAANRWLIDNARLNGVATNAASASGLAYSAYETSMAQGKPNLQKIGQATSAAIGFGTSTFVQSVSRETVEARLNGNFFGRLIKKPALGVYDWLEDHPTATVAFVLGHNGLGSWAALRNRTRSRERKDEIRAETVGKHYGPIESIGVDPETGALRVASKVGEDGDPWSTPWDMIDDEGIPFFNEAKRVSDTLKDTIAYRSQGWIAKDAKGNLRPLTEAEFNYIENYSGPITPVRSEDNQHAQDLAEKEKRSGEHVSHRSVVLAKRPTAVFLNADGEEEDFAAPLSQQELTEIQQQHFTAEKPDFTSFVGETITLESTGRTFRVELQTPVLEPDAARHLSSYDVVTLDTTPYDKKSGQFLDDKQETVTVYKLPTEHKTHHATHLKQIADYQNNNRLQSFWWLYLIQNAGYALFSNLPFALLPRDKTPINHETLFTEFANEILDAVPRHLGSTPEILVDQTYGRMLWNAKWMADNRKIRYAIRKGHIQIPEGMSIEQYMVEGIKQASEDVARLSGKTEELRIWKSLLSDINPVMAYRDQTQGEQLAGAVSREQTQANGVGMQWIPGTQISPDATVAQTGRQTQQAPAVENNEQTQEQIARMAELYNQRGLGNNPSLN